MPRLAKNVDHHGGETEEHFAPIEKLNRDLRQAARDLTPWEVTYLINRYYYIQERRIISSSKIRAAKTLGEPSAILEFNLSQDEQIERQIQTAMGLYAESHVPGQWMLSLYGVGPVLSAGFISYIDITRAKTVSHIWNYAGLNSKQRWLRRDEAHTWIADKIKEYGEVTVDILHEASLTFHRRFETLYRDATTDRRTRAEKPLTQASMSAALARCPWNRDFKKLCWKFGDCVVKFHNRNLGDNLYGILYGQKKAWAVQHNLEGGFAELAAKTLASRNWRDADVIATYKKGMLPPSQVDGWARRHVVTMFLSHLHHVMHEDFYKKPPPQPYILAHDPRHTHYIPPPHWPL